ncbi:hypothetical protein PQR34_34655 [Paraburkholderia sediminicola]|uniref:hypothetical protein n=2 Tax=Paraburkholderia sediminicola TaxID=458836 RepID=UPI0038BAC7C8
MVNGKAGANPMKQVVEGPLSGVARDLIRISADVVFHREALRSGTPGATADEVHAERNINGASGNAQLSLELDEE